MRIGSTNGVNDHLRALEAKGAIVRDAMKSRAIALTDALDPFEGVRCVDFGGVLAQIDDEDVWSVIDCETDDVIGDHLTRAEAFARSRAIPPESAPSPTASPRRPHRRRTPQHKNNEAPRQGRSAGTREGPVHTAPPVKETPNEPPI